MSNAQTIAPFTPGYTPATLLCQVDAACRKPAERVHLTNTFAANDIAVLTCAGHEREGRKALAPRTSAIIFTLAIHQEEQS